MKRHEISDEQWNLIQHLLPKRTESTGRKPRDQRQMFNEMFWILRTGEPWRDLTVRFGPWQTAYDYYRNWRDRGIFEKILQSLQICLDRQGKIDWDLWCIDGSSVRASRAAAGASKKTCGNTPESPQTTLWAAQEADSAVNSTTLFYPLNPKSSVINHLRRGAKFLHILVSP